MFPFGKSFLTADIAVAKSLVACFLSLAELRSFAELSLVKASIAFNTFSLLVIVSKSASVSLNSFLSTFSPKF